MVDKEGTKRKRVRVQWWQPILSHQPIHSIARASRTDLQTVPTDAIADTIDFSLRTHKPVFIGHYWLTGKPALLSEQVVCVDYSAAIDSGLMTAYCFDTEQPILSAANFVQYLPNSK